MKTHKIGSITFGAVLILFGTLFLLNKIINIFSYELVIRAWPVIFIGLGIEILLANIKYKNEFVYDWTAIWLMILLVFFGMGMALLEQVIRYYPSYISI